MEALGLCPENQAAKFVDGGERIARNGLLPINTGGGQLSGGRLHGFGGIFEACVQARGEAGPRQVLPVPTATVVTSGTGTFSSCILIGSAVRGAHGDRDQSAGVARGEEMYDVASGVKVVEVAMYMFVPTAGAVLADWGADIIKIGHPDYADPMRGNTIGGLPDKDLDVGFMWEISNRGKRSVGVNLATAEGYDILRTLVSEADVFLTSFRPSARQRLRIDVEDIRAINPDIVYARGSGQGVRGPQHDSPGFDHTSFWARSGLAHAASMVTGEFVPQPGPALGDLLSGFALASGIIGALFKRDRTGLSSIVDVSLLGTGVFAFSPSIVASELYDVDTIPRLSHRDLTNPMVGAYDTKDGRQVYLSGLRTDQGWAEFCTLVDRPDLADDPRFGDGQARLDNRRACIEELDGVFATRTLADWQQLLASTDIAWATVQTARDAHADAQVRANSYVTKVMSSKGSTYPMTASPVQFDEEPLTVTRAPEHGEHTDEILAARGLTWEQLLALKGRGVIS